MIERYLPVPVWNNVHGYWEPIDFRNGQRIVNWPDGFDPGRMPIPAYRDGERVQFVRDETCAREGSVKMVLTRGGVYGPFDNIEEVIEKWYCDPEQIIYIVTARGHDHRIHEHNITGLYAPLNGH